jgi:HEAT repeat protein
MTVMQLQRLLVQAKGPKAKQRVRAIEELAPFANYAREAVQGLIDCLDDRNPRVRQRAAMELGYVEPPPLSAVTHLIKALKDQHPLVRESAVTALKNIGPDSSDAVAALIEALEDHQLVHEAIDALGAIGPPAKAAVPILLTALENKSFATITRSAGQASATASEGDADLVPIGAALPDSHQGRLLRAGAA